MRLDSAHDARDNRNFLRQQEQIDFLIKWNPRKQDPLTWADKAQKQKAWSLNRDGKMEAVLSEGLPDEPGVRRIVKVTVRTSDAQGQLYLEPEVSLEGWVTSLPESVSAQDIMNLYCDHATSEQFHSEFKTDLDLERLPSGKFDTNNLVMAFATLGYNLLRWMGLPTGSQRPTVGTALWPLLPGLCGLSRPVSRPRFFGVTHPRHSTNGYHPTNPVGTMGYCLKLGG